MKKSRKHYSPAEKVAVLRRHLLEKEPISKLCDELGLQPTVFYRWQKEFFENGAAAFEQKARPNHSCVWGLKDERGTVDRGYDDHVPATSRAVRRTSSSIASVSTPVNVFCWLGW